jgi:catechol 2,3-dioxygenase-like lactoylglutathione lyase family enzyme
MIDHIGINVSDYAKSKQFYLAALAPLGYKLMMEGASGAGFNTGYIPDFWIRSGTPMPLTHIAFSAANRAAADAFYRAALAAGGRDNGAPGLRPQYHPNYYGAFVLDPDGYNIEAVCHQVT